MFRRLFVVLLALAVVLSACSAPGVGSPTATVAPTPADSAEEPTAAPAPTEASAPTAAPAPTTTPAPSGQATFKNNECLFNPPSGVDVVCGTLTVPEDRADPTGAQVELAVAIFKSPDANPEPDPVVYLEGGPGGHALQAVDLVFEERFAPFIENRDLIIFDQRGTGYSKPSLACDEYTKLAYDMLDQNLPLEEDNKLFVEAMTACHERLASEGVNFQAYNSLASAADIEDLRVALGYEQWNLLGSSYGTRLALTTMREYPDGIRSVILDSTRSVQSSETSTPGDIDRAFNKLFDGCAADPDCNRAFPNLREVFFKTVDRLNATPATGEATNPFNGDEYQIVVSGDDLIGLTIQGLYSTNIIAQLPKAIYAASTGADYNLLIRLALNSALQNEFVSYGMFYAVRCNEEVSFETPETLAAADDAFPQFRNLLDQSLYSTICTIWNAGTAPAVENQPVTSDIPTLILSGEYDPATPPDDGRAAAATLSNSYFFEFPGLGHGISAETECSLGISKAFLNDPTSKPDDSCVAQMGGPAFTGTGAAVKLKPITSSDGSFETVIPETWEEVGFGVYAENTSSSIALIMIAFPGNPEDTLDRIQSALSAEGDTDPDGEYKTDQLTWTLYDLTIQNQPGNVALAEGDGRTYVVILISDKVEQEALVKTIFNPVLDAFTPR